ncbi:MAG: hypothetical protein H6729_10940 [Deltaproteobacteria bacterium]|nr:hypothetical protein [Deltaproteobacteria bacterium]
MAPERARRQIAARGCAVSAWEVLRDGRARRATRSEAVVGGFARLADIERAWKAFRHAILVAVAARENSAFARMGCIAIVYAQANGGADGFEAVLSVGAVG